MTEGVAVAVRKRAFGRGSYVGKDERGGRFGGQSFKIDTIPGWDCGGEDTRLWTQGWRCVVAYAESIAIVRTACILVT